MAEGDVRARRNGGKRVWEAFSAVLTVIFSVHTFREMLAYQPAVMVTMPETALAHRPPTSATKTDFAAETCSLQWQKLCD